MRTDFGTFSSTLPSGRIYDVGFLAYEPGNSVASEHNPIRAASVTTILIDKDGHLCRDIASLGNLGHLNFTANRNGTTLSATGFSVANGGLWPLIPKNRKPIDGLPAVQIVFIGDAENLNISTEI